LDPLHQYPVSAPDGVGIAGPAPRALHDPARGGQTIAAVTSVFTLKNPVKATDVYAPGFVAQ